MRYSSAISPTKLISAASVLSALVLTASGAQAQTLSLTGTVRDFLYYNTTETVGGTTYTGHEDFQNALGDDRGIVSSALGSDNKPVYASSGTTATTSGAANFNLWYNDTAGVNQSTQYTLTATPDGSGNYVYSNSAYFPIDGQLLGNQGDNHNFAFTTEIHTNFTYQSGQVFGFSGDDDVWVFINKTLAIDLGGVHSEQSASVDLDSQASALGITEGQTYQLDIFQAERHTTDSNFKFTTNITLTPNNVAAAPEPGSIALLLTAGVPVIGILRRRKQG